MDNDRPLQLLQQLSSGLPQSITTLLEQLSITPAELQQAVLTLEAWGIFVQHDADNHYQIVTPPPRLNQAALRHYSQHNGVTLIPVLPSTNQYLFDHYRQLQSGDACVAEYQSAGRGQRGRAWHASFGSCALFSMLWHWPLRSQALLGLSLALSVVTAETLQQLGATRIKVKWPNDLYREGGKLGGVLIESVISSGDKTGMALIIGCGINLFPVAFPQPINQPVVSLQAAECTIEGNQLIGQILYAWRRALRQFAQQGMAPFLSRWPLFDAFIGARVQLQTAQGGLIVGVARGIDHQGALLLEQQGKIQRFTQGKLTLSP